MKKELSIVTKGVNSYKPSYAYPSSTNAKAYGFEKEGCYHVNADRGFRPPIAVGIGYASKEDADKEAMRLTVWLCEKSLGWIGA